MILDVQDSTGSDFRVSKLVPDEGAGNIASCKTLLEADETIGISLLFSAGQRPDTASLRLLVETGANFSVSLDPGGITDSPSNGAASNGRGFDEADRRDWLEVLADGLTFDLSGLAPGSGCRVPDCGYRFDLAGAAEPGGLEAVHLRPGPHLAGGERMLPVIRAMAGLAASLCVLPGLVAVAWHPARSWIGPRYFTSIIGNWLEGGVFPGLGLVGLAQVADGGMQSEGLAFFTDQELRIEPELTGDRAAAAKVAVRLIDRLIEHGRLERAEQVIGPEGKALMIEPSANGRLVRVWSAS